MNTMNVTKHRRKILWIGLATGLKKACRQAGLHDVTWHAFRHTFTSRLNGNGADLVTVKELLGHADTTMVLRYAHLSPDHLADAVEKVARSSAGQGTVMTGDCPKTIRPSVDPPVPLNPFDGAASIAPITSEALSV